MGPFGMLSARASQNFRSRGILCPPPRRTTLEKRTLTSLYNGCPTRRRNAHLRLDAAVLATCRWLADIPERVSFGERPACAAGPGADSSRGRSAVLSRSPPQTLPD